MKQLSIRLKLAVWYFTVLVVCLILFGIIAFVAMRRGIEAAVDESLRSQASGIQELVEREWSEGYESIGSELREHSKVQAKDLFFQVSDAQGQWIYRSQLTELYDLPLSGLGSTSIYNLQIRDLPLRVLTTEVRVPRRTFRIQVAATMVDFYGAMRRFKWVLLLSSPFLLVLASAGGYWMSRRALTPVDEIIKAVQGVNSKNLSSRLNVPQSNDELQRLSETLNNMLQSLEGSFKKSTDFTADASHELRTPIALMRTMTELSLRMPHTATEYREVLVQILGELERTSVLVEKLMLLARADVGFEVLQCAQINLVNCLKQACCDGATLAEAKQLTFCQKIAEGPVVVNGDSNALQRLFLILIDNAVKYTPTPGSIQVSLRNCNGFAVAEVRDNGIGIDVSDLPHIFERFYRADKARSRESGGIGLGLSIGRWIAEAHGGSIGVQSTLGGGSVFEVRLPVVKG
jgi:heavy metal sensor kinase